MVPIKHSIRAGAFNGSAQRAFTLVEVLVASAVLSLVVVCAAQIVGQTTSLTTVSTNQIDSASQARAGFDLLANQFAARVRDPSVPLVIRKNLDGNDSLCFVAMARSRYVPGAPSSRAGVFVYGMLPQWDATLSGTASMLCWRDRAISWSGSGANIADAMQSAVGSLPKSDDTTPNPSDQSSFTGLSDGVLRFEIALLLSSGTTVAAPKKGTDTTLDVTDPRFASLADPNNGIYPVATSPDSTADPQKRYVKALVVGIAVLNSQSRQFLLQNNGFQNARKFPDVMDGTGPIEGWGAWLSGPGSGLFPRPVTQSMRFYQKTIYLN